MNHKSRQRGFSLIEAMVTIGITSLLFLAISNLMITFFRINLEIKHNVEDSNEKEIVYLSLKNFLDEAEKVAYMSHEGIILKNKRDSTLQPFTAITTSKDTNKLVIYNFAFSLSDGTTPIRALSDINDASGDYVSSYNYSQIYKGNGGPASPLCSSTITTNCILVGGADNILSYGTTGYAPFIKITKPTAMYQDEDNNELYILSPYEGREYKVNLTDLTITTTENVDVFFPYTYVGSGTPPYNPDTMTIKTVTFPDNSVFDELENQYGNGWLDRVESKYEVTSLSFRKGVYHPSNPNPQFELDQLIYTLQSPTNQDKQITTFLFKMLRR